MRRFIIAWKVCGYMEKFGAKIVNFADDLVICCKHGGEEAMKKMRYLMELLKLTVNEEKTKVCHIPGSNFTFLGYEFGEMRSFKKQKMYIGMRPAEKKVKSLTEEIHKLTARNKGWMKTSEVVQAMNSKIRGWSNYFSVGAVTKSWKRIDAYAKSRLRWWLCKKHKKPGKGFKCFPDERLYKEYGLINLPQAMQNLPWAKA
jgi:hypothetical protein